MQIATERLGPEPSKLELRTEDFDTALRETRVAGGPTGGRIIGFLGEG